MAGEESKNKKEYRFYMLRPGDGRYVFKCNTPQQRDEWTISLSKIITVSPLHCSFSHTMYNVYNVDISDRELSINMLSKLFCSEQ